ncbi:hypothetical protein E27107_90023 [Elizabethkingia anophelis]|nr:hypothetical protein E18064_60173 [Elizabethkingia anophelis]CDN79935.1 hypothetical protein E27107_90023 [Elizabethkingia anophelis]
MHQETQDYPNEKIIDNIRFFKLSVLYDTNLSLPGRICAA